MINKNIEIGIIGFGNFGQLMAKHLSEKVKIFVTDNDVGKKEKADEFGAHFVSLEEVCGKKIVVLAMPMEKLEKVLNDIKGRIYPGTLVLDVCSLKVFSCGLMEKILPENIDIVGTHPLFGPQSAPDSIEGMRIVLCNVRGSRLNEIVEYCKSLGLEVFVTTPENHDKQMAYSQALTHFIGQVAKRMDINRVELSTKTFDDLMDVIEIIKNDTKALFENMQTMNPYAKKVREDFVLKSRELNEYLIGLK